MNKEIRKNLKMYAEEEHCYFAAVLYERYYGDIDLVEIFVCRGADELSSVKRFAEERGLPVKTYTAGRKPAVSDKKTYRIVSRSECNHVAYRYA